MRIWLFCFLISFSFCFGVDFRFKQRLEKAKSGDYIITEANKMITLLTVRSISPKTVIFEEISAPVQNLKERPDSWADWVKAKAPGHTSWSMVEIDLQNGEVLECYSFSRSTWVRLSQKESLFATLLQLPMKSLPADKRRKIGPAPMPGELDVRKIWNPPLVHEGKKQLNSQFDVFETTWPTDGTELSNKDITVYFDKEKKFALPFWIQVETSHLTAALQTIDSGKNLPSVHRALPRRIPEFVGYPQKTDQGLSLSVKSPKYYQEFELFAIDVTTREKQIHPISHSLTRGVEEWISVEIDQEELNHTLEPTHRYTWLLVPAGHSESYTQSIKPFIWEP